MTVRRLRVRLDRAAGRRSLRRSLIRTLSDGEYALAISADQFAYASSFRSLGPKFLEPEIREAIVRGFRQM